MVQYFRKALAFVRSIFTPTLQQVSTPKESVMERYSWLLPPDDLRSPEGWDTFWQNQFSHHVAGFCDLMVNCDPVVDLARRLNLSTVLCVGPGPSLEPYALKWAGLKVTAIDISPVMLKLYDKIQEAGGISFGEPTALLSPDSFRDGGSLEYIIGDFFDETMCPGPFDIIVERKTIQLYPEAERDRAVACLLKRLAVKGVFFSHCHDNRWNPNIPERSIRIHSTGDALRKIGVEIVDYQDVFDLNGRVGVLFTSTG